MKDALEDFIRKNREGFDHREPGENVWSNIESNVKPRNSWWSSVTIWRAAAVLFMGLSAYLFVAKSNPTRPADAAQWQGELRDVETFYKEQIAEKVALIENFENGYEDDSFTQDLQKLDAMYQVLREEMKSKPSAKVKDALVLNMIIRIDLLNQQIKKLEDSNKPKAGDVSI